MFVSNLFLTVFLGLILFMLLIIYIIQQLFVFVKEIDDTKRADTQYVDQPKIFLFYRLFKSQSTPAVIVYAFDNIKAVFVEAFNDLFSSLNNNS